MSRRGSQRADEREVRLVNDPKAVREAQEQLLEAVNRHRYPEAAAFAVRLAFEEAVYNALRHGHREIPDEPIDLKWSVGPSRITITVEDHGPGFKPEGVPDPTSPERIELPHGRGLMLMRAYMSDVRYNAKGNRVVMVYEKKD